MFKLSADESPFNTPLETGLRSVCILEVDIEQSYDLQKLLAFDHLVVHSGDIEGAPQSIHVDVPQRNGELLVRRPIVEQGLLLMESKGLLVRQLNVGGMGYRATELSSVFLNSMTNSYLRTLRHRAEWAVKLYNENETGFFQGVFNIAFDRWASEFQFSELSLGSL